MLQIDTKRTEFPSVSSACKKRKEMTVPTHASPAMAEIHSESRSVMFLLRWMIIQRDTYKISLDTLSPELPSRT